MLKLAAAILLLSPLSAFAAAKTHHCEVDGKEVTKTHQECKTAKGKWVKNAGAAATPAAATTPAK